MVTVIVPIYKTEKYLKTCIESILNQTYADFEIILVDDGSPDNSGYVCDEFSKKDKRIKVIHKENGGLSSARNEGLEKASGDYITFVDSDDYVSEKYLENMLKLIQKDNCDIAMCGCALLDEKGEKIGEDKFIIKKYYGEEIINSFVIPLKTAVWNKLFTREIIGKHRFPSGRIHGEDLVFLTSIIKKGTKMVTSNDIDYYYIKHPNSITTGGFNEHSFDEVYCKDVSYENVLTIFPKQAEKAMQWRFRSRMNLLRKITIFDVDGIYICQKKQYEEWINDNFRTIKSVLSPKDILEYFLYKYACYLYRIIYAKRF